MMLLIMELVLPVQGLIVVSLAVMVLLVLLVLLDTPEPHVLHVWLGTITMEGRASSAQISVFSAVSVPPLLLVCSVLRDILELPATPVSLATTITLAPVRPAQPLCLGVELVPVDLSALSAQLDLLELLVAIAPQASLLVWVLTTVHSAQVRYLIAGCALSLLAARPV